MGKKIVIEMNIDWKNPWVILDCILLFILLASILFFNLTSEKGPQPEFSGKFTKPFKEEGLGIGRIFILNRSVCEEEGKPIVYFFGQPYCPHSRWEYEVIKSVVRDFQDRISFHDNMGETRDVAVYQEFSRIHQGRIPFLVIGCKYVKIGSGEPYGFDEEKSFLTTLICKILKEKCGDETIYDLIP